MNALPLFDDPRVAQIRALLRTAGTTKDHDESVQIEWPDRRGVTSYRVTEAVKAEIERLRVGLDDARLGEGA